MPAVLLDGDALAATLRRELAARVAGLVRPPRMAIVLVGEDPASRSYVDRKLADCAQLGLGADLVTQPADVTPADLLATVAALNADARVDGFFVQFPLPGGQDEAAVASAIAPHKDIDGLHPLNLGRLMAGLPGPVPCTAAAVLALLRAHRVPLAGRHVVIVGRGRLVGRPLALMLGARGVDATVTLAHSATPDLARLTRQADMVIAAAGQPDLIRAEMIRPGAAVLGVGISYRDGQMVSDLAADVAGVAGHVTPPHGSVGALTRAMLLRNLITLAGHG